VALHLRLAGRLDRSTGGRGPSPPTCRPSADPNSSRVRRVRSGSRARLADGPGGDPNARALTRPDPAFTVRRGRAGDQSLFQPGPEEPKPPPRGGCPLARRDRRRPARRRRSSPDRAPRGNAAASEQTPAHAGADPFPRSGSSAPAARRASAGRARVASSRRRADCGVRSPGGRSLAGGPGLSQLLLPGAGRRR
jgi:hypothetical protein